MSSGRPGGYVDDIVPGLSVAAYPSGTIACTTPGQSATNGIGSVSRSLDSARAWLTYPAESEPPAAHVQKARLTIPVQSIARAVIPRVTARVPNSLHNRVRSSATRKRLIH